MSRVTRCPTEHRDPTGLPWVEARVFYTDFGGGNEYRYDYCPDCGSLLEEKE